MTPTDIYNCPQCSNSLKLTKNKNITCDKCNLVFDVNECYLDFTTQSISDQKKLCGDNWSTQFGEWFEVNREDLSVEESYWGINSFFKFSGLTPEKIKNKQILVICGGSGREAWHLLHAGAAHVYILDIGQYLAKLNDLLKDFSGKFTLIRADAENLPLKTNYFDICICDHALQHVPDHKKAFSEMYRCCKLNGLCSICVYSYEGNFLMTGIVEPLKPIFHKLPLSFLSIIAFFCAIILYIYFSIIQSMNLTKLPFYDLLFCWKKNGFKKYWEACFDFIQAPVSYHFKKQEVFALAHENKAKIKTIKHVNQTMWTLVCIKDK